MNVLQTEYGDDDDVMIRRMTIVVERSETVVIYIYIEYIVISI